jgi:hypothetical protein
MTVYAEHILRETSDIACHRELRSKLLASITAHCRPRGHSGSGA